MVRFCRSDSSSLILYVYDYISDIQRHIIDLLSIVTFVACQRSPLCLRIVISLSPLVILPHFHLILYSMSSIIPPFSYCM